MNNGATNVDQEEEIVLGGLSTKFKGNSLEIVNGKVYPESLDVENMKRHLKRVGFLEIKMMGKMRVKSKTKENPEGMTH